MGWGSGITVICGVCHRFSSDPELLWLWCRLAATARIQAQAWKPPYAADAALEKTKNKKIKNKNKTIVIGGQWGVVYLTFFQ